jgi:hypothetical protein
VSCSEKKPVPKFSSKRDFPLRSSSVVSTPQVDAIWGEEVAMSITLLLASIVVSVPTGVVQIDAASSTCTSPEIMMGSHKTAPQQSPPVPMVAWDPAVNPKAKALRHYYPNVVSSLKSVAREKATVDGLIGPVCDVRLVRNYPSPLRNKTFAFNEIGLFVRF